MPAGSGVAFSAAMKSHYLHTNANQDIVFDKIITNIGGAFHNSSSLFVATVPGVYVFRYLDSLSTVCTCVSIDLKSLSTMLKTPFEP